MEQNNSNLTPEDSLRIIRDSLDQTRRDIVRSSSSFLLLWGGILFVVSLAIYFLWGVLGSPVWNYLWFAIPLIGYPAHAVMSRRREKIPENEISSALGRVWTFFGVISITTSILALTCCPMNITLIITALFGFTECVSGILLKNWTITAAGTVFCIAGTCIAQMLEVNVTQALLFTFAGALLALTGLLVKYTK